MLPIENTILTRERTRVKLVTIFNENRLSNNVGRKRVIISATNIDLIESIFFFSCVTIHGQGVNHTILRR
jgi:hypothetical protein